MYEDYMQDYYNQPLDEFQNTYENFNMNTPYWYEQNRNTYDYNYGYQPFFQTRGMSNTQIEELYPDVYKIVYPVVKKTCNRNSRMAITQDVIENMVEEVYSNIEQGGQIELNRSQNNEKGENNKEENRGQRRNSNLLDVIKILVIRELIGELRRPGCRPNMPPPPPPPHHGRPYLYTRPPFNN